MTLGRYRLVSEMAHTEIVQSYSAYDTKLERQVTIKVVTHSKEYSDTFTDYFLKEARVIAQLSHPSITKVLDFGRDQGFLYLVLESVSGTPLVDRMGTPIDWRDALTIIIGIANALDYAHENNVIHRDLKPANIIINSDGLPVLNDFSIARIIEDEETRDVTGTNAGLGTPAYMSPEQGKGIPVDSRADIYSLGVIMFELITGEKPFTAQNDMEVLIQQIMAPPPDPKKLVPDLPRNVERIILTCLKKDPDDRFQSMGELINAIDEVRAGRSFNQPKKNSDKRKTTQSRLFIFSIVALLMIAGYITLLKLNILNNPFKKNQLLTPTFVNTDIILHNTPTVSESSATLTPDAPTMTTYLGRLDFQIFPRMENQALVTTHAKIGPDTINDIQEVHRLGDHPSNVAIWSLDDSSVLLASSNAIYFLNPATLALQGLFPVSSWPGCIALSKDESKIAIGSLDGKIYVISAEDGSEIVVLEGHEKKVSAVSFSPDASILVSASDDKTVRVWDLDSGSEKYVLRKHGLKVNSIVFSNHENWFISGSDDFHVIFWDSETGDLIENRSFGKRVTALDISSDDELLAIGLSDASIKIWNIQEKKEILTLKDTKQVSQVTTVKYSPNNSLIVTGAEDGLARVWNVNSGDKVSEFKGTDTTGRPLEQGDRILSSAFSNDGTKLITLTKSNQLSVWLLEDWSLIKQINLGIQEAVRVEFSNKDEYLFVGFNDQFVRTWNLKNGRLDSKAIGELPDGYPVSSNNRFISVLDGELLKLRLIGENGTSAKKLYGIPPNGSVSFLPDSKMIAASGSRSNVLWATTNGYQISPDTFKYEHNCYVAYSKDGEFLVAGSVFGPIINSSTYSELCKTRRNPRISSVEISRDSAMIAQGLTNGDVEISYIEDELLQTRTINDLLSGEVMAVAISPDRSILVAGGESGEIRFVDLSNDKVVHSVWHHTAAVRDLTFSIDGKYLASSSSDGTIQIWSVPQ